MILIEPYKLWTLRQLWNFFREQIRIVDHSLLKAER